MILFSVVNIIDIMKKRGASVMKYISTSEAAKKWGLSRRRVAILCKGNRIEGVQRAGQTWIIPETAEKPDDARIKNGKYIKKCEEHINA